MDWLLLFVFIFPAHGSELDDDLMDGKDDYGSMYSIDFDWERVYESGNVFSDLFWTHEDMLQYFGLDDGGWDVEDVQYVGFNAPRPSGAIGSPWPTFKTRGNLQKGYYSRVRRFDKRNDFVTDYDCDDGKLWDVLHNLAWIEAEYSNCPIYEEDSDCQIISSITSATFVSPNQVVSGKHGLNDIQCYSNLRRRLIVQPLNFDDTCTKHDDWEKWYLVDDSVFISTKLKTRGDKMLKEGNVRLQELLSASSGASCTDENDGECTADKATLTRRFWGNFGFESFREDSKNRNSVMPIDIKSFTTTIPNHRFKAFTPWYCPENAKILVIGHPSPVNGPIITNDGLIPESAAKMYLRYGYATISKGVITHTDCGVVGHYLFSFEAIVWSGHTGGFIVLEEDPTRLCGMTSMGKYTPRGSIDRHIGVCSKHYFF